MKSATEKLLRSLATIEWFTKVGEPITSGDVAQVFTWEDALNACTSRQGRMTLMESLNILTETLHNNYRERYREWNKIGATLKEIIRPLVEEKIRSIKHKHKLPPDFKNYVAGDIAGACKELEYSDLVPPRFFQERVRWYLAGHWPCGWEGDFPEGGRLVVY